MVASPIYLVRHAETTLNAACVVQYPDTPLSSHGQWQALRLAAHLHRLGITHVVSSDYTRARATATTICDASKAALTVDPILRERHLGELRGRPYSEVRDQVFSEHVDPPTERPGPTSPNASTDCGRGSTSAERRPRVPSRSSPTVSCVERWPLATSRSQATRP